MVGVHFMPCYQSLVYKNAFAFLSLKMYQTVLYELITLEKTE